LSDVSWVDFLPQPGQQSIVRRGLLCFVPVFQYRAPPYSPYATASAAQQRLLGGCIQTETITKKKTGLAIARRVQVRIN
jgi:hypothetical protein